MANSKSAEKRVRSTTKKRQVNLSKKSAMRKNIKKVETAVQENTDNKEQVYRNAIKKIDQAVSKGLLHRNTAARKKSRLSKLYKQEANN